MFRVIYSLFFAAALSLQAIPVQWAATSVVARDGSLSDPSITFGSSAGTGFSLSGGILTYSKSSAGKVTINTSDVILASAQGIGWSSNVDSSAGAIDTKFTRASAGVFAGTTTTFASLGTPANGSFALCTDCTPTTPATCPGTKASCVCTSGGLGSLAIRVNSLWYCSF